MIAASCRDALVWSLTPGQVGDSPEGLKLVEAIGPQDSLVYLLMDSAYEGDDMRVTALQRNEVERLFRRIKAYRRVFTRCDKLDVMYATFFALFALSASAQNATPLAAPSDAQRAKAEQQADLELWHKAGLSFIASPLLVTSSRSMPEYESYLKMRNGPEFQQAGVAPPASPHAEIITPQCAP